MEKGTLRRYMALLVLLSSIAGLLPARTSAGTIVSGGLWVGTASSDYYIHFRATQRRITKLAFTAYANCVTKDTGEDFSKSILVGVGQTPALTLRNGRAHGQFEVNSDLERANVRYNFKLAGSRGTVRLTYWYDIELEACTAGPVRIPVRRSRAR